MYGTDSERVFGPSTAFKWLAARNGQLYLNTGGDTGELPSVPHSAPQPLRKLTHLDLDCKR